MALPTHAVVVVVDDEVTVRSTARAILARSGYEVHVADNAHSAVALVTQLADLVALVLLDWTLPDMPGARVLSEVRRLAPRARVIVSTGFGREDLLLPPDESGWLTFLEKPYTAAALLAAVAASLGAIEHGQQPGADE